ncbi:MAG: ferritin family protein [Eisenbergiella sp.]
MKELKNTKTEENLKAALAGESLARSKYAFYEEAARKEGLYRVADLYKQMIRNETYHAKKGLSTALSIPPAIMESASVKIRACIPALPPWQEKRVLKRSPACLRR